MNIVTESRPISRSVEKIVIFRALYLGDLLLSVPALRAIRRRFPHVEITLIGLPWAAELAGRFDAYIDRFLPFPGYPGIDEVPYDPERTARFLEEQRRYGYDLAIQMHGTGITSNPFVLELGAQRTAGYVPSADDLTTTPLTYAAVYPQGHPEVLLNLELAGLVGCSALDPGLEFPLLPEDREEAAELLGPLRGARPVIGLHPGAKAPSRRWPTEYYAAAGNLLARREGARIVLTGGPDELKAAEAVAARMQTEPLILAGKTSLGGLAATIAAMDLFISNDTGPAHVAQAVHTPSVIIFGPEGSRWEPLDRTRYRVARRPVHCSPCGLSECPIDHRCLRWLHPEQVTMMARDLLPEGAVA